MSSKAVNFIMKPSEIVIPIAFLNVICSFFIGCFALVCRNLEQNQKKKKENPKEPTTNQKEHFPVFFLDSTANLAISTFSFSQNGR
jgi:hypothetical protein